MLSLPEAPLSESKVRAFLLRCFDRSYSCFCAATNGVVVATEKKVNSPLVDETTLHKISEIDKHIGIIDGLLTVVNA